MFQEETDTCLLLHAKHAAVDYDSIIIVADDTDLLVLSMAFQDRIDCNLYMECGTRTKTRILDVEKMRAAVGQGTYAALLGMRAVTV